MATITSAAAGPWSTGGTWIGGVPPTTGDKVIINHAVTVDGTYTTGDGTNSAITINANAALIASRSVNNSLTVSGRIVDTASTSRLDYGTDASDIIGVSATLNLTNNGIYLAAGALFAKGAAKTRITFLTSLSGTSASVNDATGWANGDSLVFVSMKDTDAATIQTRTISGLAGNSFTLSSALTGTLSNTFTKVGNLSSNVKITCADRIQLNGNPGAAKRCVLSCAGAVTLYSILTADNMYVVDEAVINASGANAEGSADGNLQITNSVLLNNFGNGAYVNAGTYGGGYLRTSLAISNATPIVLSGNFGNLAGMIASEISNCDIWGGSAALQNISRLMTLNTLRLRSGAAALYDFASYGSTLNDMDFTGLAAGVAPVRSGQGSYSINKSTAKQTLRSTALYSSTLYGSVESLFETIAGVANQHEYLTPTGALWSATDQTLNGATSMSMYRRAGSAVQSYAKTFPIAIGETKRIRFNARRNATYAAGGMPTVSLSMPGVTTVTVSPTDTQDTWFPQTLSLTNTTGAAGQVTITVQWQGALSASSSGWIDGLALYPYVTQARWYGDVFDESNPFRLTDATLTLNEAAAAAVTGVAINHGTQTITVTAARTAQEVYCYAKWNLCQTANLGVANHITSTGGQDFTTTYTVILSGAGAISGNVTAANGVSSSLALAGLTSAAVLLVNNSGTVVDYQASVTGTYTRSIPFGSTGTWTWVVKRPGYTYAIGTFTPASGGTIAVTPSTPQKLTPEGAAMYTGSTSTLVDVSFTGTTQGNIDIGNGTAALQPAFNETEIALATQPGMQWLASGKGECSIFDSGSGDYLFMTAGWRLRRRSPGDSGATFRAFVISADGIPVDESNGGVMFLSTDSPTAIAAAVWATMLEGGFSADRMLRITAAAAAGKTTGGPSGFTARNLSDTANQIVGTADAQGNRGAPIYGP